MYTCTTAQCRKPCLRKAESETRFIQRNGEIQVGYCITCLARGQEFSVRINATVVAAEPSVVEKQYQWPNRSEPNEKRQISPSPKPVSRFRSMPLDIGTIFRNRPAAKLTSIPSSLMVHCNFCYRNYKDDILQLVAFVFWKLSTVRCCEVKIQSSRAGALSDDATSRATYFPRRFFEAISATTAALALIIYTR